MADETSPLLHNRANQNGRATIHSENDGDNDNSANPRDSVAPTSTKSNIVLAAIVCRLSKYRYVQSLSKILSEVFPMSVGIFLSAMEGTIIVSCENVPIFQYTAVDLLNYGSLCCYRQ
jgi:hypothetical protein